MSEPKPPAAGEIAGPPRRKRSPAIQWALLAVAVAGLAWAGLAIRDSTPTRRAFRTLINSPDPVLRGPRPGS